MVVDHRDGRPPLTKEATMRLLKHVLLAIPLVIVAAGTVAAAADAPDVQATAAVAAPAPAPTSVQGPDAFCPQVACRVEVEDPLEADATDVACAVPPPASSPDFVLDPATGRAVCICAP